MRALGTLRVPIIAGQPNSGSGSDGDIVYNSVDGNIYSKAAGAWRPLYGFALNSQFASYTLAATDTNDCVTLNSASAVTLTVPPVGTVAFPVGTQISIIQLGAGQVTLTPGSGVTIYGTPGLKLRAQYSGAALLNLASNVWIAVGDLAA